MAKDKERQAEKRVPNLSIAGGNSVAPKTQSGDWKAEFLRIGKTKPVIYTLSILAALVALRLGVNWWLHHHVDHFVARVKVVAPVKKTLDTSISLPGNVEAIEEASLFAHVSGYLKKIYVDEGDKVKKGQLLAVIDAPDVVQEFRKAKAEYDFKETTRKRYEELVKEKVVSQQEYDTVEADANEAKARFDNADANMGYTRIIAPFAGSIARRFKYPGDLISTATHSDKEQPIFVLVNEARLRIVTNVPQIEIGKIQVGHDVDVHVDAHPDQIFRGTISRVDALLDDSTKTERVLVDMDNPDNSLRAGMFATVSLHLEKRDDALTLPTEVVMGQGGTRNVYVVREGVMKKIPVTVGIQDEKSVEITSGLSLSDQVVLPGSGIVPDGTPVQIMSSGDQSKAEQK